jgi:hypothetical protein
VKNVCGYAVAENPCHARDLSQLLSDPDHVLTSEEEEHFDEFMSFKNNSKSAKDVSLTDTVKEVVADLDYYLGFKREKINGRK